MTGGFDTNVPARKPRTMIGQILTELASTSEATPDATDETVSVRASETRNGAPIAPAPETLRGSPARPTPERARDVQPPDAPSGRTSGGSPDAVPNAAQDASRLAAGRDRIASLRERLTRAARPPVTATEPRRAAAAVLDVVQDLRARLQAATRERSEAVKLLGDARSDLARVEAELRQERKLRAAVESRAEERARIAAEAVTEAEALAAERDQVLSELTEQRRLDDEQAALLTDADAALELGDEERAAANAEVAELRNEVEARAIHAAEMEGRLQAGIQDRTQLEARCKDLEARVAELNEAWEALDGV